MLRPLPLLLTLLTLFAGACSAPVQDRSGEEIRVAIGSDLRSTEPGVDRDASTDDIMNHVVEGLVGYRSDLTPGPVLAKAIERSADGLTYRFKLRPDVLFHNGEPLEASDVVWSIQRQLRPDSRFLCKNWYDGSEGLEITGVRATQPDEVEIQINEPDALFLTKLANFQCLLGVVHPNSAKADGTWVSPIGTGPYTISDWQKGRYVLLERFEQYQPSDLPKDGFAGARIPEVERIRWMVIPDAASARAALYSGDVDLIYNVDAADLDDLRAHDSVRILTSPSLDWNVLLMQTSDPILQDRKVRLAISHAIDRSRLAEAVTAGISSENPSAVAASSPYFGSVQRTGNEYDPQLAARLLKESGYDGQTLRITTNRRYQHMFDNAVFIQAMLKDVGFNAELDVTEWTAQLSRYFAGDFQLMTMGFSARVDPALAYAAFLGDKGTDGWAQWQSAEASELLLAAGRSSDPAERQKAFDKIHRLMVRDAPMINLYNHYIIHAVGPRVEGYEAMPTNKIALWGVDVDEQAQGSN